MRISVKKRTNEPNGLTVVFLALLMGAGFYTYGSLQTPMVWLGGVALLISVVGLSYSLVREELILEIDEQGIFDRGLGIGKIRWKDVEDVQLQMTEGAQFLCFRLTNPDLYTRRLGLARRNTVRLHHRLGLNRFNVDVGFVDINPVDLKRLVDFHIQK